MFDLRTAIVLLCKNSFIRGGIAKGGRGVIEVCTVTSFRSVIADNLWKHKGPKACITFVRAFVVSFRTVPSVVLGTDR